MAINSGVIQWNQLANPNFSAANQLSSQGIDNISKGIETLQGIADRKNQINAHNFERERDHNTESLINQLTMATQEDTAKGINPMAHTAQLTRELLASGKPVDLQKVNNALGGVPALAEKYAQADDLLRGYADNKVVNDFLGESGLDTDVSTKTYTSMDLLKSGIDKSNTQYAENILAVKNSGLTPQQQQMALNKLEQEYQKSIADNVNIAKEFTNADLKGFQLATQRLNALRPIGSSTRTTTTGKGKGKGSTTNADTGDSTQVSGANYAKADQWMNNLATFKNSDGTFKEIPNALANITGGKGKESWTADIVSRLDPQAREMYSAAVEIDQGMTNLGIADAKAMGASGINTKGEFDMFKRSMPTVDWSSGENMVKSLAKIDRYYKLFNAETLANIDPKFKDKKGNITQAYIDSVLEDNQVPTVSPQAQVQPTLAEQTQGMTLEQKMQHYRNMLPK